MVAPVRNIGNKFSLSSANTILSYYMTLSIMPSSANTGIDLLFRNISDNYNEVRSRIAFPNFQSSRASFIFLSKSLVAYHVRMENNNDLEDNVYMEPINNSQLLYATPME